MARRNQGVYYFGATDLYLKMPTGEANLDVLAAAREGLRSAIRTAIERAAGQPKAVTIAGRVKRDGVSRSVSVTARSVTNAGEGLILLSFVEEPQAERSGGALPEPELDTSRAAGLKDDLDHARQDLETAIRDRDIAEEEVRAINEEAMSVNEEFQTTSEELQTSHEQLQSLNEELTALDCQIASNCDPLFAPNNGSDAHLVMPR